MECVRTAVAKKADSLQHVRALQTYVCMRVCTLRIYLYMSHAHVHVSMTCTCPRLMLMLVDHVHAAHVHAHICVLVFVHPEQRWIHWCE